MLLMNYSVHDYITLTMPFQTSSTGPSRSQIFCRQKLG